MPTNAGEVCRSQSKASAGGRLVLIGDGALDWTLTKLEKLSLQGCQLIRDPADLGAWGRRGFVRRRDQVPQASRGAASSEPSTTT